jgi:protein involved in polysaccharide export with SLBB domain
MCLSQLGGIKPNRSLFLKYSGIPIIILIFFIFSSYLYSQSIKPYRQQDQQTKQEEGQKFPRDFDIDLKTQGKSVERILPPQQYLEQTLEIAIDSTRYLLGPGDLLLINILGPLENQVFTEVTPEGFVVIPGISDVYISGLSLQAGSEKIKSVLDKYYEETQFTVRLMRMRKFRVYAVGEITNPGTYFMRGVDRLSDLIELAKGISSGGDETQITIQHIDGNVDTVDISDFYRQGIKEANPYLAGGDVVHIPMISLKRDYVFIEGNLDFPGIYQVKENETLVEFLYRLKVINRESNIEDISLTRNGQIIPYNLLSNLDSARTEILQSGDRLFIPPAQEYVYVKGEVYQPGAYPYLANFKAKDYAGMAGVLETAQSVDKITVVRAYLGIIIDGGETVVGKGDVVVVPQRRRENVKDILAILTPIISIGLSTFAIIQASK